MIWWYGGHTTTAKPELATERQNGRSDAFLARI